MPRLGYIKKAISSNKVNAYNQIESYLIFPQVLTSGDIDLDAELESVHSHHSDQSQSNLHIPNDEIFGSRRSSINSNDRSSKIDASKAELHLAVSISSIRTKNLPLPVRASRSANNAENA